MSLSRMPRRGVSEDSVYFIKAPVVDLVKIGYARDVAERFARLRTLSPVPLELVHVVEGAGRGGEVQLHEMFADLRDHGEWFRFEPPITTEILKDFIEQLAELACEMSSLNEEDFAAEVAAMSRAIPDLGEKLLEIRSFLHRVLDAIETRRESDGCHA